MSPVTYSLESQRPTSPPSVPMKRAPTRQDWPDARWAVDGHPVHRAKLVNAWEGRHADRIERHFLPGYSPELNPVELLNHDVKATPRARGVLARRVSSAMSCMGICVAASVSRRFCPLLRSPDDPVCRRLINHTICLP